MFQLLLHTHWRLATDFWTISLALLDFGDAVENDWHWGTDRIRIILCYIYDLYREKYIILHSKVGWRTIIKNRA